jgi:hypothetical protein
MLPLLKASAPDAKHPKRVAVAGTPHMLRHSYATALQTLMGITQSPSRWISTRMRGRKRSRMLGGRAESSGDCASESCGGKFTRTRRRTRRSPAPVVWV